MLNDIEELENKENSSRDSNDESYLQREKAELKELQQKLEQDKKKYKEDKKQIDALKYSDPTAYRVKSAMLEKVKESIEHKIDKVNDRIAKVKQIEKKH